MVNYQMELEKILGRIETQKSGQGGAVKVPTLFLHSCCAPCSSYVLEYLAPYFQITVFYYNPNISMEAEYQHRVQEQKRLIAVYNEEHKGYPIEIVEGDYQPAVFYEVAKGYEQCAEGGERCFRCYGLRLRETALQAAKRGADYFGTTLTISPLKNAQKLNEIGYLLEREIQDQSAAFHEKETQGHGVVAEWEICDGRKQESSHLRWLPSDFKKKGGYQRSIELSGKYELYRQDFCGCSFSKAQRELVKQAREAEHRAETGGNAGRELTGHCTPGRAE